MTNIAVTIDTPSGPSITVGTDQPLLLIGGPCALESEELARTVAGKMIEICARLGISYVFKASFDKANRTSLSSYRGLGLRTVLPPLQEFVKILGYLSSLTSTTSARYLQQLRFLTLSRFLHFSVVKPTCWSQQQRQANR